MAPMTNRGHAEVLEVVIGQVRQHAGIDIVRHAAAPSVMRQYHIGATGFIGVPKHGDGSN